LLGTLRPCRIVNNDSGRFVMTEKADVYKCDACGCIVNVLKGGEGDLNCCDKKMREVTPDEAKKLSFGLARPGAP
jgi:desulfoferrodoxin-like iron-binding protein